MKMKEKHNEVTIISSRYQAVRWSWIQMVVFLLAIEVGSATAEQPTPILSSRVVGLVQLIVNPSKFKDMSVSTIGFLEYHGALRLYLTKDHERIGDTASSIAILDSSPDASLTQSRCRGEYVQLTGTLHIRDADPVRLRDVAQVVRVPDGIVCWRNE
jgi:hypothetical protein